jgi:N-methylhydantoinase B
MKPGDVYMNNYPYWSSAHSLDVLVFAPIFVDNALIGYASCRCHILDLKQKDSGYVLDSTDMYQEGVTFPAVRLYEEGKLNKDIFDMIRFNSRMPEKTIGDVQAEVSAVTAGVNRTIEIAKKYGSDVLVETMKQINDNGAELARVAFEKLPKGEWIAEDFVDSDGIRKDVPVKMHVKVTIDDEGMTIDWRGSAKDVVGPINLPLGETIAVSSLIYKAVTTPDTTVVAGNFRQLKVITEPGSLMHAVPPMPTFTQWTGLLAGEVVLKALAQAMSHDIPACSGGDVCSMMGVGVNPRTGRSWLEATNEAVGFGAMCGMDGEDGIMHLSEPGCRNNPIEVLETKSPMFIESYGYREDSGGAGEYRGGVGVSRVYRFLAPSSGICLMYKSKSAPWSLAGGNTGVPNQVVLNAGTDHEEYTAGSYNHMATGETLSNNTGGGGGYGNPLLRDPVKVEADVKNGFVSSKSARDDYGVVLDENTSKCDLKKTEELRMKLKEQ